MIELYLNANHNEITWNKKNYLLAAARRMGLEAHVHNYIPSADFVPEYILNIEPYSHIVTGTKWTGVWEIDCMFDRNEMNLGNWTHCDTVFLANTYVPDRMDGFKGNKVFMFQAADPDIHRRIPEIYQEYDFVFSGSNGLDVYRERERLIQFLRENNFTFNDFGKGHPPEKYVEFLNHAAVQWIRSASKPPIGTSQVEQRFFECLAIGPVLKDYHPALETLGLVEGEDFFWYKDDQELLVKMHHLIDNPDFAREMAENGRRKVLLYHTYEHRLASIIRFAQEHAHA